MSGFTEDGIPDVVEIWFAQADWIWSRVSLLNSLQENLTSANAGNINWWVIWMKYYLQSSLDWLCRVYVKHGNEEVMPMSRLIPVPEGVKLVHKRCLEKVGGKILYRGWDLSTREAKKTFVINILSLIFYLSFTLWLLSGRPRLFLIDLTYRLTGNVDIALIMEKGVALHAINPFSRMYWFYSYDNITVFYVVRKGIQRILFGKYKFVILVEFGEEMVTGGDGITCRNFYNYEILLGLLKNFVKKYITLKNLEIYGMNIAMKDILNT